MRTLIFILSTLFAGEALALKLQVSAPAGSYVLESEALRWKLTGRGRALSFKERTCAKEVWESLRQRIDAELTGGFARLPDSAEKFPKGLDVVHFEYNGKSFRIPAASSLGKYLNDLPDAVIVTRKQERIYCDEGEKK